MIIEQIINKTEINQEVRTILITQTSQGPRGVKGDKGDQGNPASNLITSVNGQIGDVLLDIPTNTSDLINDSGFITDISGKVDKVTGKQLSTEDYTTTEKTKLAGIATGATANSTDAQLRDRSTHTGAQAITTITGLQTALDSKATPADIDDRIEDLIGTAPANLDTLQEIAAQLANDESDVSALTTVVSGKQAQLNGTGFVKASGTTVSYDNSAYTPTNRNIATTAPLQGGGSFAANRTFSITQATTSTDGYLSSADWNLFNGKIDASALNAKLNKPGTSTTNALLKSDGSGGTAESTIIADSGAFTMPPQSTNPPVPSSGVTICVRTKCGRSMLQATSASGRDYAYQPSGGDTSRFEWMPTNGTAINTLGCGNTLVGTRSTPALASTNLSTSIKRWRNTSAATANSAADERSPGTLIWRGNAAGIGGFDVTSTISPAILSTNCCALFGLTNAAGALSTTLVPSAAINVLAFGWDALQTTMRFICNDGSGTATMIDLGTDFPTTDTTAVYKMRLFCKKNDTVINYSIERLDTGVYLEGSVSTNIPGSGTFLTQRLYMNNGGDAQAIAYECVRVYGETDL